MKSRIHVAPALRGPLLSFLHHASRITHHVSLLALCLLPFAFPSEALAEEPTPFPRLFDTGSSSESPLAPEAIAKREGWRRIPEGTLKHEFTGDAVLANDKLAVVFRTAAHGLEVYSLTAAGPKLRASLGHAGGRPSAIGSAAGGVGIAENTAGAIMVEVGFSADTVGSLKFRLTTGEGILEIRAGQMAKAVHVTTKGRYLVIPDFFADDMVFGRNALDGVLLPAENFLLSLIDGGDAIAMCVWQSGQQTVSANSIRVGDESLSSWTIDCLPGKSIWLAFLEGQGIWQSGYAAESPDAKLPFPAKWRITLGRMEPFAQSWELGKGPGVSIGRIEGPCIAYPIDRTKATPLTAYCVTDILRNTLGVGPCQYILATEGLGSPANPTPDNVMDWVEKQFRRKNSSEAADEIKERLKQMVEHMGKERARIEKYSVAAAETLDLCRSDKWPRPKPPLAQNLMMALDSLKRFPMSDLERIGPAARPAELAGQVAALIGKENAPAESERLGAELRGIGAKLDGTLSRCRMRTRWLRQQCRMAAAREPQSAELARLIQERAERMLQAK